MDTVTQVVLGAAVGEAVMGRQAGRRAVMWGGFCGLFPDLDILIPLGDAVRNFTYHRGASHSVFVLAALTPLFVWLILKIHPDSSNYRKRWHALAFLAFLTHVLLDCFTVYGTQILWPLPMPPVMWSTIFIIDPAYTIPLLIGVIAALVMSRKSGRGHLVNAACLGLSSLYLLWSVGAKLYVENAARESLVRQHIRHGQVLTVPTPFNTLLWRVLAMDDEGYHEGFYSLFDGNTDLILRHYPSDRNLLRGIQSHWPVRRLQWFTHGFYSVKRIEDGIVISDLRMGLEPNYVFSFRVGQLSNPHAIPVKSEHLRSRPRWERLLWLWRRIWTPEPGIEL